MDLLAALEKRHHPVLLVVADALDLLAEAEGRAPLAHEVHQRVDHLAVHEIEDRRTGLDDGDLDVERRDHRRVLEADHAGAHDDEVLGERVALQELIGIDDPLAVERHRVAVRGPRAAGDQDVLAAHARRAVDGFDFQGVGVHEARRPRQRGHMIAVQLRADDFELAHEDLLDAEREVGDRDVLGDRVVAAVERPLAETREIQDRLAQRLRRDGAGVQADAADHLLAVDQRDLLAELGGGDRALLPGRPGPDHDEVVGGSVHVVSLSRSL